MSDTKEIKPDVESKSSDAVAAPVAAPATEKKSQIILHADTGIHEPVEHEPDPKNPQLAKLNDK